jgi:hypothetical protein
MLGKLSKPILMAGTVTLVALVIAGLPDMKRYIKIRQM